MTQRYTNMLIAIIICVLISSLKCCKDCAVVIYIGREFNKLTVQGSYSYIRINDL